MTRWGAPALAVVLAFTVSGVLLGRPQEPAPPPSEAPRPSARPTHGPDRVARTPEAAPRRSQILVTTDLACEVSVDFKPVAKLPAGGHATVPVEVGAHFVSAVASDGATWKDKVNVGADQAIVEIVLAGAVRRAAAPDVDAQAAAVVGALADVRGAGSYVAWVLEKKAFGYHDLQLTVSLQRAATRLKRELEKQQTLKAADAERARAQEELARAAAEAAQYASLLTEAATTAQSEGTSFGKSAQMRGQALAHLPLMALDKAAVDALRASEAFKAALAPDRWPEAGLAADPRDFDLGAEYDGDSPARLGALTKGGVADALGLKPGDRVLSVDGQAAKGGWEMKTALRSAAGRAVTLEIERDGKRDTRKASVPASLTGARR